MENFKCALIDQGIHIQGKAQDLNGKDYEVSLFISYEEENLSWGEAMKWAKDHGGMPTCAQLQAIQIHRDEINKLLEEAGKEVLTGWYWTSEELDSRFARCVRMNYGHVSIGYKEYGHYVRAVSAFPIE